MLPRPEGPAIFRARAASSATGIPMLGRTPQSSLFTLRADVSEHIGFSFVAMRLRLADQVAEGSKMPEPGFIRQLW